MIKNSIHSEPRLFSPSHAGIKERSAFGKFLTLSLCLHLSPLLTLIFAYEPSRMPTHAEQIIHVELGCRGKERADSLKTSHSKARGNKKLPLPHPRVSRPAPQRTTRESSHTAPVSPPPLVHVQSVAVKSEAVASVTSVAAVPTSPALTTHPGEHTAAGAGPTRLDTGTVKEDKGKGGGENAKPGHTSSGYRNMIRALIESHKVYPPSARRMGIRGSMTVSFTLGGQGEIKRVSLAKSSGHPELDNAGIKAVRDVGRFPPPPRSDLAGDEISFLVPIRFSFVST